MTAPARAVPGVLLTGGASRRMGTDKAAIVVDGTTLAARAARVLAAVCDPVVEVGPGGSGLDHVREEPAGSGPLRALVAGVDALGARGPVVVLGCDLPFVDEATLRLVAQWPGEGSVVPIVADRPQYACARWSADAIARCRRGAESSLRALVDEGTELLDESVWGAVTTARAFADVDTPGDLARLFEP